MSKQQPAKAKKGKKDAVEARIAKVQLVVGEDKVSRDVIKRVLDAHANDVAAAANAILDGDMGSTTTWEEVGKSKKTQKPASKESGTDKSNSWSEMTERADRKGNNSSVGSNGRLDDKRRPPREPRRDAKDSRPARSAPARGPPPALRTPTAPTPTNRSAHVAPVASKTNAWTPSGKSALIKLPPGVAAPEEPPTLALAPAPAPTTSAPGPLSTAGAESPKKPREKRAPKARVAPKKSTESDVDSAANSAASAASAASTAAAAAAVAAPLVAPPVVAAAQSEPVQAGGKVVFLPGFSPQGEDDFRLAPQGAGRRRQQHLQQQQQAQQQAQAEAQAQAQAQVQAQAQQSSGKHASESDSEPVMGPAVPGAMPMMMPQGSYGIPFGMMAPQQYAPIVPPQDMASQQQYYSQQQQQQQQQGDQQQTRDGLQPAPGAYPMPMGGQFGYQPYYQYPPQYSPQFNMMYGGMQSSQQKKFVPGMLPAQYAQQYAYQQAAGATGEQQSQSQSQNQGQNQGQSHYYPPQMMQQGAAEYGRQFQLQHQQQQQPSQQSQQQPSGQAQPQNGNGAMEQGGFGYPMYSFINPGPVADSSKKGASPSPPASGGGFYPFSFGQQQMVYPQQPLHQGAPPPTSNDK